MAKVDTNIDAENAAWSFDDIADQFDDHVHKSVPLYDTGHELVCQLSDFFLPPNATVTEIGVSTGALADRFLRHNVKRADIRYIGIDTSEGMIARATTRCAGDERVQFLAEDAATYPFEKCSMIISYYTLQFTRPRERQMIFDRIYNALEWGGAFLLFEKVRAPDSRFQDIMMQIYQEYKLQRHFSEAEIVQKQRSLKGVLEPFSTEGNIGLMQRAGFVDIMTIMKWVCFEGFLAIK